MLGQLTRFLRQLVLRTSYTMFSKDDTRVESAGVAPSTHNTALSNRRLSRTRYAGSLLFNIAAFILPALYGKTVLVARSGARYSFADLRRCLP